MNTPDCGRQILYAEDMISGQLIAGLINNNHHFRLLAEALILTTLKVKFGKLVSLETTDKSTNNLLTPRETTSAGNCSEY